jgi:myo-inositol-1(or 4)-monophosphatase
MDINWLKVCRECLRAAAAEVMRVYHSEKRGVEISIGRGGDKTLIADKASEDTVIQKLLEAHADARLISEERGELLIGKRPQHTILLDPLDGSFNFKQGLAYFCVSMAVLDPEERFILYLLSTSTINTIFLLSIKKCWSTRTGQAKLKS